MVSISQLWLPILLSAVLVFFASSLLNMVLKFWHGPDFLGFSNEDEVGAAIRKGGAGAGTYMIPFCTPENMKKPGAKEKFLQGPVGTVALRAPGPMNLGAMLARWFVFCLLVSWFSAYLAASVLPSGTPYLQVFRVVGTAAFMAHALGSLPNAIWWNHPWRNTLKYCIDGLVYALLVAGTFGWLWPK
jgi:hypothetical protein